MLNFGLTLRVNAAFFSIPSGEAPAPAPPDSTSGCSASDAVTNDVISISPPLVAGKCLATPDREVTTTSTAIKSRIDGMSQKREELVVGCRSDLKCKFSPGSCNGLDCVLFRVDNRSVDRKGNVREVYEYFESECNLGSSSFDNMCVMQSVVPIRKDNARKVVGDAGVSCDTEEAPASDMRAAAHKTRSRDVASGQNYPVTDPT